MDMEKKILFFFLYFLTMGFQLLRLCGTLNFA